jgi:hypothetical protein
MRVAPAMTQGLNRSERRPSRNSACGRSRWLAGGRCSSVCWDDTCRCNTACIGAQIAVSTRRSGSGSGHNLRAGLGWAGLGWAGLGWAGLGWAGLGWAGLGWAGLGGCVQARTRGVADGAPGSASGGLPYRNRRSYRRRCGWLSDRLAACRCGAKYALLMASSHSSQAPRSTMASDACSKDHPKGSASAASSVCFT